ncbi:MAG: glycosyltransferase family 2 protein [Kineosporiaceae bacterium]
MSYELVLVTYRSRALAEALLNRLPGDTPVAVVDNAQGADGVQELTIGRPAARYLSGPGEGFARAANLGASTSRADYLLFVNPDSAPTIEQLESLVGDLKDDPQLIAVGAATILPDGRVELGAGGWEPTPWRCLVHALALHWIWPTAGVYSRPTPGRPVQVDWLSGACLAVPREAFLELGGFDERFFVYNEDMAFGRRAREAGRTLRLRTDLLVPHLGGGSGDAKPRMFQMRGASMMKYVAGQNGAAATAFMRAALTLATAIRFLDAWICRRPELARAHAAYLKGMWRGAPDMT